MTEARAKTAKESPKATAAKKPPATAAKGSAKKPPKRKRYAFKMDDYVVYPAHGVGRVVEIREQEIAGHLSEWFVVDFSEERMRLSVPVGKASSVGMRRVADNNGIQRAFRVLRAPAKIRRTMWSRRAQEYEAKINSGDLHVVAEVVRDLYRPFHQPERSYSERQLYERALERMAREVAVASEAEIGAATGRIEETLARAAEKKAEKAAEKAEAEKAEAEKTKAQKTEEGAPDAASRS